MRVSSRAIIIENGKVLTMFRRKIKDGVVKEYYVIPGGGQDECETLEQTVKRELKEELNIDIKVLGFLGNELADTTNSNYFHCEIINGIPQLGGEELERMTKENYYEPQFIEIEKINNLDLFGKAFVYKALNKEYIK